MTTISKNIEENIEQNRGKVYKKDFTFFNIELMPRLASISDKEQCGCDACKANIQTLEALSKAYPALLASGEQGKRKLEDDMDDITAHLCKAHGYSRKGWYKSLYSLYGFAGGMAIGAIAAWLAPEGGGKLAFLVSMLVCMAGAYIYGWTLDGRQEKSKKII